MNVKLAGMQDDPSQMDGTETEQERSEATAIASDMQNLLAREKALSSAKEQRSGFRPY